MVSSYRIPPPIEEQQKASGERGSSVAKSLVSLAGSVALFWLAHHANLHALRPLAGWGDRLHQVQAPLMEAAGAAACGMGFIVWQHRPALPRGEARRERAAGGSTSR